MGDLPPSLPCWGSSPCGYFPRGPGTTSSTIICFPSGRKGRGCCGICDTWPGGMGLLLICFSVKLGTWAEGAFPRHHGCRYPLPPGADGLGDGRAMARVVCRRGCGVSSSSLLPPEQAESPQRSAPFAMVHTVGTSLLSECIPVPALPPLPGQTWGTIPILSDLQ